MQSDGNGGATHPQDSLRGYAFEVLYEGFGVDIRERFLLPALHRSVRYDRLTGFFTVESLAAIADGVDDLWRRKGSMRLVLGVHDVPPDIVAAADPNQFSEQVVGELRKRLLLNVSTIREEILKDRLNTLAWMMEDGFLEVKVAVPKSRAGLKAGIFHRKRLLFRDAYGNEVVAMGSQNETIAGLTNNSEELNVNTSWQDERHVVALRRSFEEIWVGPRPDFDVYELDATFAHELLTAAGGRPRPSKAPVPASKVAAAILQVLRQSPLYGPHNLGPAVLFPHQERAFLSALGRWPVRVLLADEVGLGKTLEAGAVIASLIRSGDAESVAILSPKNVARQWQAELKNHFDLDFWFFDSASSSFNDPAGRVQLVGAGLDPAEVAPPFTIVSAQLARGTAQRGHYFSRTKRRPDLLVVDEAHAARVRRDLDGSRRPTLLWRMLESLSRDIRHLILVTATPVQLETGEYHSILELLGLPQEWAHLDDFQRSLRVLAQGRRLPELEDAKWALRWLNSARDSFHWPHGFERWGGPSQSTPELRAAIETRRHWEEVYPSLVAGHPASLLTVRNTRGILERCGYRFPSRDLQAPNLAVSAAVRDFYGAVEVYLTDAYGTVEQASNPGRRISLGFVRSSYHQRLASSLHAAGLSLRRRRQRILDLTSGRRTGPGEDDEVEDEPEEQRLDEIELIQADANRAAVDRARDIELAHIDGLIERLDRLLRGTDEPDPKIGKLNELLGLHRDERVLVFSRYTDTVDRCIAAFEGMNADGDRRGYAKYTGGEVWTSSGWDHIPATKEGVQKALEDGVVRVVFCSDAASEGLNLQAARIIINIDVPWNPARLEQRIGRIARLGQEADTVVIYNLWYPNSVEARMYGRLLQRREDYELAVGECPQIFARAIREQVMARLGGGPVSGVDPFEALQAARHGILETALKIVWDRDFEEVPGSQNIRRLLLTLLLDRIPGSSRVDEDTLRTSMGGKERLITAKPGRRNSLSFAAPELDAIAASHGRAFPNLVVILEGRSPFALALRSEGGYKAFLPEEVVDVLAYVAGNRGDPPLPTGPSASDPDQLLQALCQVSRWYPKWSELRTLGRMPDGLGPRTHTSAAVPIETLVEELADL